MNMETFNTKYTLLTINSSGTLPPIDVRAVQAGPTSVLVSWRPSSNATGYNIDYTSCRGHSRGLSVNEGSTVEHLLTELQEEDIYSISIVATSDGFPSESVIVSHINLISKGKH